ncbi:DUF421 domain-containing protein [Caldibacillus thermoamylovorans]|uniref:DUF421 domain-containing protein n=1 Tax=Caldibacillus thermoamylovorans TaxID=35841 RepID=UPI001FD06959|nr:YetF domain-containing protein [Caldibacillus thermoamylovorans]
MEEVNIGLLTIKVIVGFATLFFIIIITGRTSISQLTPFHLVYVLVLGDFLGNTIYQNQVGIFHFLYAIGLWTLLMLGIEFWTLKNKSIRSLLLGDPNIIIRDGVMDRKLLKKNKLDVNQVFVFCNRKVQRNAIKNAEVCHPFNSFSTMRGTVYSSRHEKR